MSEVLKNTQEAKINILFIGPFEKQTPKMINRLRKFKLPLQHKFHEKDEISYQHSDKTVSKRAPLQE